MKIFFASIFLLLSLALSRAQTQDAIPLFCRGRCIGPIRRLSRAQTQDAIPLWPIGAPGSLGTSSNDIPTITPFLPATNATGAAMVICPGGGYQSLSSREGRDYALWLNQHGLTCFVLKYRLGSHGYHYPVEFQDVERAVRWVRAHASEYGIDSHRVGIMGSSAGGHLASMGADSF